jgi:hypothetical protein
MTVAEQHILFKLEMDKIDTLSYPNFLPASIDLLLNEAQDLYTVSRYSQFEQSQKRTDDLRTLVTEVALTPTAVSSTQYAVALPSDYWFKLRSNSFATGTVCGNPTTVKLRHVQVTQDRLDTALDDPFNAPDADKALVTFVGTNVQIYTNGFVPTSFNLTYLRKPLRLQKSATGVNNPVGYTNVCELPDHTHREIVALAVRKALESIESPRYTTNRQEPIE